jgi:hypothetical protein
VPRHLGALALLGALCLTFPLAPAASAESGKVTISGKAYVFNHMDTFIPGAKIEVRELPKLSTTTDANGDYFLRVPDDTTVTPYIDPPDGYNQIDLQTFHTRGKNIVNANFQTPADLEYGALAALLGVPFGPDGRPEQCVIVSTASARNVRGVDYPTFVERTPHGVAGATAEEFPAIDGPTYFNASVIPDPTVTSTSSDGGMIWTAVPPGTYRIATTSPSTRFAGFLATCKAGRVVNANPPWGAYELSPGEKPLAAGVAIATVGRANISRVSPSSGRRLLSIGVKSPEAIRVDAVFRQDGKVLRKVRARNAKVIHLPVRPGFSGRVTAQIKLTDRSGGVAEYKRAKRVKPPKE